MEDPRNTKTVVGEIEVATPSCVSAPCSRCGRNTPHARDEHGALHCRRCMFDESVPPAMSPDRPALDPFRVDGPGLEAKPSHRAGFVVIAIAILIVALFVHRVL